ncbi:hypothetical protein GQ55_1G186300 [Panicum hallii var. hallii]|uniref:Uncharacterized protein n=1 Tax=Panicum hallii var. hallii TaxID=1504633 RepID=A0A2T7F677_9POAL|nr:hypothetical protein GQ55_1G186300 [Panicum hallii var. hallii]
MSSSDVSSHVAGKQRDNLPAKLSMNSGDLGAGGWRRGILARAGGVPSSTSRDRHRGPASSRGRRGRSEGKQGHLAAAGWRAGVMGREMARQRDGGGMDRLKGCGGARGGWQWRTGSRLRRRKESEGEGVPRDRASGQSKGKQGHLASAGWRDGGAAGRGWLDDAMVAAWTGSRAAAA